MARKSFQLSNFCQSSNAKYLGAKDIVSNNVCIKCEDMNNSCICSGLNFVIFHNVLFTELTVEGAAESEFDSKYVKMYIEAL